jgi:Uma2 family endonuclease
MSAVVKPAKEIVYPSSDGKRMAENTLQFQWIQVLSGNLAALFQDAPDVFIGGDLLWYPREGDPNLRQAPDVFVVFGRPKGHRPSYKQWEEGGVPMTVVFEVLSPGNRLWEMADKLAFYDEYGVEEYYLYDPDDNQLRVYVRGKAALRLLPRATEYTSPRLGVQFDPTGDEMVVYYPDGRRFMTFEEIEARNRRLEAETRQAEAARQQAEAARQQAEAARQQAEAARQQAEARFARLAELSRKARLGQATADELRELEQLEARP